MYAVAPILLGALLNLGTAALPPGPSLTESSPAETDVEEDTPFRFAVFSDLTGGERPRVFEIAIAQLNLLRPELILNVGDLVEGETDDRDELNRQWDDFDQRAAHARAPVYYVGGNHDLAGEVMQAVWDERNGPRYYHFIHRKVLFLVLDTEDHTPERTRELERMRTEALARVPEEGWGALRDSDYGRAPEYSAGNISAGQATYFREVIAANPDVRWTFLFLHKAAWERHGGTPFSDIEDALADRPYTVFHGHEHAYRHQQRRGRDYIRLATTGGVQLPAKGRSMDHITLVTVSDNGVDIANLLLSGILDKTGHIPLNGDDVCFESARCESD
ncbi:metallophosphoesterase family protein [Elongatibacter sediminis]|uniref:Metallophosphoesterase n=1 Tax=Elongatibacter sediminis TaxID=3119006 RepID=A0AAW9RDW9_9GAMM